MFVLFDDVDTKIKRNCVKIHLKNRKNLIKKSVITFNKKKITGALKRDKLTTNIKTIRSVPLKLKGDFPSKFDIRGEIILPHEGFARMNRERIEAGEEPYMNPRNTASGSLKLQDSATVSRRPLASFLYTLEGDRLGVTSQFESLEKARQWGFKVPEEAQCCKNIH